MSRILPVPPEAIAQIQSSKQITSLQGVVLGLLENSLDAGSSKIEITTDFRRGGCTVDDNGIGIQPSAFLENGGLAQMYHTSKRGTIHDQLHGSNGTFLASVAALSLTRITSRVAHQDDQGTLLIHQGHVLQRDVSVLPNQMTALTTSQGTCVAVRDLFGNMPVRVKQRSSATEATQDDDRVWHELKRGVVALLLAWPKPCSVRLGDEHNENRVLHLSAAHPYVSAALTKKVLCTLDGEKAKYHLSDALPIMWQAGLISSHSRSSWVPVSAQTPGIVVKGSISLDPIPTKECQFISIGVSPCTPAESHQGIYDAVNKVFANSSFGTVDDDSDINGVEEERRKRDRRFKRTGYTRRQLHGRKRIDRWPMFAINISLTGRPGSIGSDRMSDASLTAIDDVLTAMVTQWLSANHFRHRKQRMKRPESDAPLIDTTPVSTGFPDPSGPTPRLEKPEAAFSGLVRAASTGCSNTFKRQKVIDRSRNADISRSAEFSRSDMARDCFHWWSRIKSGRDSFYGDLWNGRKPATAPAGQVGTKDLDNESQSRDIFDLPSLEAGELNSGEFPSTRGVQDVQNTDAGLHASLDQPLPSIILSDGYGSFDELEALAAEPSLNPSGHVGGAHAGENFPTVNESDNDDLVLNWTDPISKRTFQVNGRTGVVVPSSSISTKAAEERNFLQPFALRSTDSSGHRPLSLARRPKSRTMAESRLPESLKDWNNPVFTQQNEAQIPALMTSNGGANGPINQLDGVRLPFASTDDVVLGKLSKAALQQARFIQQVDRKYLLAAFKSSTTVDGAETMVLIDQHAASERVILERLLSELCAQSTTAPQQTRGPANVTHLQKSLHFEISDVEFGRLREHRPRFLQWGVSYDLEERNQDSTASQVRHTPRSHTVIVRTLPSGIAERCALVPKVLIDLLRSEVWGAGSSAPATRPTSLDSSDKEDSAHDWLGRIGTCPKGILEMFNSRACRSAVMFNDELSTAECEHLLKDLGHCAFPFMCAHGRVSMVPVAELGDTRTSGRSGEGVSKGDGHGDSFTAAFRNWQGDGKSRSFGMNV